MKKLSKIIRVITIPPVMVFILLMVLFAFKSNYYKGVGELILSIVFLMIVPILAYPISYVFIKDKSTLRENQRKLAFVLSLVGYGLALIYGIVFKSSDELLLVYTTYFLSVILLTCFNKVIKLRASGHACSIVGPLVIIVYFIGYIYLIPSIILLALVVWSSLYLKRHTLKELLFGSLCSILAFIFSLIIFSI